MKRSFSYFVLFSLLFIFSCEKKDKIVSLNIQRPLNLTVSKGDYDDKIFLTWDSVANAELYQIYRQDSLNNDYFELANVKMNFYSDTSINEPNQKFYYKVRVFNSDIEYSEFSDYDYGFVCSGCEPTLNKPINFVSTKGDYLDKIVLTWDSVASAEQYQIYRHDSLNKEYIELASVKMNFYNDTSIHEPNRKFYYKVRAFNSDIEYSEFSDYDYGYTCSEHEANLDTPVNLACTKGDYVDKIVLTWEGTPSINNYQIYRYDNLLTSYTFLGETSGNFYYDTTGLVAKDQYYYKVRAYHSEREFSEFSDIALGYTDVFESLKELVVENGETVDFISLNWETIKGADGYEIYRSSADTLSFQQVAQTSENYYHDQNVDLLTNYYYKVRAFNNKLGTTEFSDTGSGYLYEKYNLVTTIGSRGFNDGQLSWPYGILFDKNDHFYVSETSNWRIQKFNANGSFIEVFAQPQVPRGMEWSIEGELVVAESGKNKMSNYNLNGEKIKSWGDSLYSMREIDIDDEGNIYIIDHNNHRVQKYDKNNNFLLTWGSNGTGGGKFEYPWGIEYHNNQILVADENGVQFFNPNGDFIKKWNLNTAIYYISELDNNYYFACSDYVLKVDSSGKILSKIGLGDIELAHGIGFDSTGKIFIVDTGTHDIKVFDKEN